MNSTQDTMQKLISTKSKYDLPLQTIKIPSYNNLADEEKLEQVKMKAEQLEDFLVENHLSGLIKIELGQKPTSERTVRYLNRMIRTAREGNSRTTATNFVVEIYEIILGITGDHKSVHREIYKALDEQVPLSSIRRILSQYRNGKLG